MFLFLLWFIFAIVIGAAANARGRSGIGWFILAVIISPLMAGVALALFPNLRHEALLYQIANSKGTVGDVLVTEGNPNWAYSEPEDEKAKGPGIAIAVALLVAGIGLCAFVLGQQTEPAPSTTSNTQAVTFIPTVDNENSWSPSNVPDRWPQLTVVPGEKPLAPKTNAQKLAQAEDVMNRWRQYTARQIKQRPTMTESGNAIRYLLTIAPASPDFPAAWSAFIRLRKVDREISRSGY